MRRNLSRQRSGWLSVLRVALWCLFLGIGTQAAAQQGAELPWTARFLQPQDTLVLRLPARMGQFGSLSPYSRFPSTIADIAVAQVNLRKNQLVTRRWNTVIRRSVQTEVVVAARPPDSTAAPTLVPVPRDSAAAKAATTGNFTLPPELLNNVSDLGLNIDMGLESKLTRSKNERCNASQISQAGSNCFATLVPEFNGQFNVRTGGVVADRVFVNVDYDSKREFDASNNISVYFKGKSDEALQLLQVGNVSLNQTPSRFLTSGIPAGNYGVLASGQLAAMRFNMIFAQQKGNVSKDNTYTVGDRTLQTSDRQIDDIQFEQRRFFFTVDPRQLRGFPNIDLLNRQQLQQLASALPDSVRPVRVYVYKQLVGATNPNPRGPQFSVRGARNPARQIYTLLRENVDYYIDPSMLWIALATTLQQNNERLAVAYEVNVGGQPGRNINTGGSPDIEFTDAPQVANLLWEPDLQPTDTAGYFQREIKSFYRLGGQDIQRGTVSVKLVTGSGGDQEKPADQSRGETYLRMFGLSQATNPGQFDAENRLWPRPQDQITTSALAGPLIRDNFIVFPSVQPFARAGLAQPLANPANDTLYKYPNEYLYSSQRPQSIYRLIARYTSEGGSDAGALQLPNAQVRPLSERVVLDGRQLVRDQDYKIDYDIGVITFSRPDTLFPQPRQVSVRYEENLTSISSPTTIFGINSQFPLDNGQLNFTAISQSQKSSFNRPQLGFEPAGSLVAGVTANMSWDATALTRALQKLPFGKSNTPSRIAFQGEFAMSRPTPNSAGQAYLDAFEGERGRTITLNDPAWGLSSLPALGTRITTELGTNPFFLNRASTLVWQSAGFNIYGTDIKFDPQDIDPSIKFTGNGELPREPVMFLTLYPLRTAGAFSVRGKRRQFNWTIGDNSAIGPTPTGRRWRSIRTVLSPSGEDLSAIENIEFFALVLRESSKVHRNPTLILDFGDISENSVAFTPETLTVNPPNATTVVIDTTYGGKRMSGFDRFDSERDPFSRSFNATVNDIGIAGSVADSIFVVDRTKPNPTPTFTQKVKLCQLRLGTTEVVGDPRANCSAGNARIDEEDIDLDGALNYKSDNIDSEQWKRFKVDLSDSTKWARVGGCTASADSTAPGGVVTDTLCWVQIRLNWRAPIDSLNSPTDRRIRAMRLTMVSSATEVDSAFTSIAISKLKLVGAPWLARAGKPIAGVAGDSGAFGNGYVVSTVVGTLDSSSTLRYQPPPGVIEELDSRKADYETSLQQVNEQSLRLLAGTPGRQFPVFNRAEAFYRIPQGTQSYMGYNTLRVWMRGRGPGWGPQGELNAYVKIGRDENNFYLYRTTALEGEGQAAWGSEVRVDLRKFQLLRAQLENNYQRSSTDSLSCTGKDLELVKHSGLPRGVAIRRYAVCQDGYIVYTIDPTVTPPNLAGVQELAVGFVRVDSVARSSSPITPIDTLELWVDDMRLTDVVDDMGFAGEIGLAVSAGDLADFRINMSRQDPNFRQLGENPSYLTSTGTTIGTTLHLERMLPGRFGIVLPLSINYSGTGIDQLFLNQTDVRAEGLQGLRNPKSSRVDYTMSLRRATPINEGWYAPVLNGLALSANWGRGSSQSAFNVGKNDNYSVTGVLDMNSDARDHRLPKVVDRLLGALPRFMRESGPVKGFREQSYRWSPNRFRVTSGIAKTASTNTSFQRPVEFVGDSAQQVETLSRIWLNQSSLSFAPTTSFIARLEARQLLDLRDYRDAAAQPDSIDRRQAAAAERIRFLGVNVGLERERSMTTLLSLSPQQNSWLRPRVDFVSSYSLYKDPNAQTLLREGDSSGVYRLPKRLGAAQTITTALALDPGKLLTENVKKESMLYDIGHSILPIELSWSRSLTSNYDNTVFTPGIGYQLGLGSIDSFRGMKGRLATGAGQVERVTMRGSLALPFSLTLSTRFENVNTDTWTRRVLDGFQALITGSSRTLPDVTAIWSWRLAKPNPVFSAISASANYSNIEQSTVIPNETGGVADKSRASNTSQGVTGTVTWSFLGGLATTGSVKRTDLEDVRPGTISVGERNTRVIDVSRSFKLPKKWNARSPLITRFSYNDDRDHRTIANAPGTNGQVRTSDSASVLTNSGRKAFSLNANTELSQVLTFSLASSHVITFDHTYNRRFSQTIFSIVLNMRFFAGEIR